jgi:TolB-like protein/Tfp pilus assembly protein PilF
MIGQRLAHYRITAAIGAGGMGQVYRATDTKLGRDVALKVLPPEMASSPERLERFQREARAVAALNHPLVVTIYSVEEADGIHFLTMELVDGQPLDRLIPPRGMAVAQVLAVAGGLADALCAAHDKGIVHRDLKPANVMLTQAERVKVLDFGLARMTAPAEAPDSAADQRTEMRTSEGVVMGTMPYMSPEQLNGHALDHRTDIFSLGIMLYEMACGERPFRGDSSIALASAILRDTPQPLLERRQELPEGLVRIISRCLEKNVADRFPSARDLRGALSGVVHGSFERASGSGPLPETVVQSEASARRTGTDEGFGVAVMPFRFSGSHSELEALAAGLTEEIVTGFSRFTYLRVRSAGNELGARYVMEGSLRQGGTRVRLAVQLVDTESGSRIWAETYERPFDPDAAFELQDDLVHRIVGTCADRFGVLARSISDAVRGRDPAKLGPYEALMRGFGYHQRLTEAEHAVAREVLERAVDRAPSNADCWAMLSWVISQEHGHGFNPRPDSLDRALVAARRAVDLAPASSLAQQVLAVVSFFRKEKAACLAAAERAIALNPLDTSSEAMFLIAFSGDWERGCALIRRAMELNPHHPRWYELTVSINDYRLGNYRATIDEVVRANAPEIFWCNLMLAAAHAQLGEEAAARKALRELLAQKPDFAQSAGEALSRWFDPPLAAHLIEGLRKAGLELDGDASPRSPAPAVSKQGSISGAARADEGFWIAVLPFKYSGTNSGLADLAEGLTEDIVTGLSRFTYLRVIARGSTAKYSSESGDVRAIGSDLGARYVMEGTLRQAGTRLRLAVQLVDATTGAHLWAENYERGFSAESVFELQDELVPTIVSTVADSNGILARSMSEALRTRDPEQLTPYEAVLRSFGYGQRVTPEELAAARFALELALQRAPGNGDAWAMLAWLNVQDYAQGFNLRADSLTSGLTAAQRAVDAAPSNHLAWSGLAQALFFHKEFQSFRNAAQRVVTLNPMDGNCIAFAGELLTYAGDSELGLALAGRAKQLNPNYPGWYWYADFYDAYRRGDDRAAVSFALRINLPGQWFSHAVMAAAYGQLGEAEAARKAVRDLLKLRPDFAAIVRAVCAKWWEPEYIERLVEGWRKAGLEIPGERSSSPSRATASAQVSIAVLPFSDMSPSKDQEYLCEGMAEEIMNALVRIDGMRVASRTSVFRAAKSDDGLAAIARALSVGHVLEGSVRTAGGRMRVTAQLTDVASGYQLWSERFDREAGDVFAIQDEIAAGVVDAVKTRLAPGIREVSARPHVHDLEAYRSYLKGRHLRGKEDFLGAIAAFEEAVRLDPAHAPSWTGLAEITVLSAHMGMIVPRDACAAARKMLSTANTLQGESAEGLHVEAFIAALERRWDAMETTWRRALDLQPDHVLALGSFAITLCARGRLDEALPLFERARQADPLASFPYTLAGWGLLMSGKLEEGVRQIEDALSFEKEDASAIGALCIANVALGRLEQAVDAGERSVAVTGRAPFFLGTLGWAFAAAGRDNDAHAILEELRARPAGSPVAVSEAWLLGALGEIDEAFAVLARAEQEYQGLLSYTGLPGFDSLRHDPRFRALLERL